MKKSSNNNIIVIFKLDKNIERDQYNYTFHSISSILEKDNDNFFIVESGELSGFTSDDFDEIYADENILLDKQINSKATINNPHGKYEPSKYAFYRIPEEVFKFIKKENLNNNEALLYLCINSSIIKFTWTDNFNYVVIRNRNDLELVKQKANYWTNNSTNNTFLLPIEPTCCINTNEKVDNNSKIDSEIDVDINKIISDIKEKIVGQDYAVESIVANIFANQVIIKTKNEDLIKSQKVNILVEGSTGTGKTAIIEELADKLEIPISVSNTTKYSSTGYVGASLTDILEELLDKTDGDVELAEHGIVCLDEFDKLAQNPKDSNNLKLKSAVQQELLSFIGGSKFNIDFRGKVICFDTSKLTFVGMGAFTGIRDSKIEELNKKTIGFDNATNEKKEKKYTITEQDYIDYGLSRELVGRFHLLVSTKTYTIDDYKNISVNSIISPLKMFEEFAKIFNINEFTYDEDFIDSIANMAYDLNFGARGLQKIISDLKNSLLLDILNNKTNSINLTTDMLEISEAKTMRQY